MIIPQDGLPGILAETDDWAIVFKPHGMPSAPLAEGEAGTLLGWFLSERPESNGVIGKKPVERGLLHRLDTDTEGIVLIAKEQKAFDFLADAQSSGSIQKTYVAFCAPALETIWKQPPRILSASIDFRNPDMAKKSLPLSIESRFRSYGPGSKRVMPLFPGMRGYDSAGADYVTKIDGLDSLPDKRYLRVVASLVRGYRHQIRAHLAVLGIPILGDSLYGVSTGSDLASDVPLQLHAISISFPDPRHGRQESFSLPIPDRMSL